jgi:hypothetical protein
MCGSTPPKAIVARISVSSSSSPRMASCKWRGVIRFSFRSLEALPTRHESETRAKRASIYVPSSNLRSRACDARVLLTGELEHFGRQVLQHGGDIDGSCKLR